MTYDSDDERVYDRYINRGRRQKPQMTVASILANLPKRAAILQKAERIISDWRFMKSIDFGGEEDELLANLQHMEWQLAVIDFFDTTDTADALYVYREAWGHALIYGNHGECIDILDKYTHGALNRNPFSLSEEERDCMVMG